MSEITVEMENTEHKPTNFIRQIIDEDLASGKHHNVYTRFPLSRTAIYISVMRNRSA